MFCSQFYLNVCLCVLRTTAPITTWHCHIKAMTQSVCVRPAHLPPCACCTNLFSTNFTRSTHSNLQSADAMRCVGHVIAPEDVLKARLSSRPRLRKLSETWFPAHLPVAWVLSLFCSHNCLRFFTINVSHMTPAISREKVQQL